MTNGTYQGGQIISWDGNPLQVAFNNDYSTGVLLEKFIANCDREPVEIPEGFITDFASVPRVAWWFTPPFGAYAPAAIVHDYLYSPLHVGFLRHEVDAIFLSHMELLGVPYFTRYIMYQAVRMFGGDHWKGTK